MGVAISPFRVEDIQHRLAAQFIGGLGPIADAPRRGKLLGTDQERFLLGVLEFPHRLLNVGLGLHELGL